MPWDVLLLVFSLRFSDRAGEEMLRPFFSLYEGLDAVGL